MPSQSLRKSGLFRLIVGLVAYSPCCRNPFVNQVFSVFPKPSEFLEILESQSLRKSGLFRLEVDHIVPLGMGGAESQSLRKSGLFRHRDCRKDHIICRKGRNPFVNQVFSVDISHGGSEWPCSRNPFVNQVFSVSERGLKMETRKEVVCRNPFVNQVFSVQNEK